MGLRKRRQKTGHLLGRQAEEIASRPKRRGAPTGRPDARRCSRSCRSSAALEEPFEAGVANERRATDLDRFDLPGVDHLIKRRTADAGELHRRRDADADRLTRKQIRVLGIATRRIRSVASTEE